MKNKFSDFEAADVIAADVIATDIQNTFSFRNTKMNVDFKQRIKSELATKGTGIKYFSFLRVVNIYFAGPLVGLRR